jgi:outer membrane protein assembly factor BamE (lipoprotein component of BamABCDE complex)
MTGTSKLLTTLATVLALAGCVHPDLVGVRNAWQLNDGHMQRIKPGMTQAEVREIVGNPPWKLAFPQREEEVWSYRYLDYQTRMRCNMTFDSRGVLKNRTLEFDMDSYSRV